MKLPELLAPAGNFEKMQTAIHYGADAVYLGGKKFSLRAHATNFSDEEIVQATAYAHEHGVQVYTTLNIFAHNDDLAELPGYLAALREAKVDGLIISDPGILAVAQRVAPEIPIHLSTQANVTNLESVRFWVGQGVKRLNLARELSLAEITRIRQATEAELEIFVHGALCISYSGRCLLSLYLTGRDANQGNCAHPCRYHYRLEEEKRPGQFFPVEEDSRGTYIFNAKDLCLLNRLPELVRAGADSLKIEGRMKSVYYVGAITRLYRAALDYWGAQGLDAALPESFREELLKIGSRGYTENFFDQPPGTADMLYDGPMISYDYAPVGIVRQAASQPVIETRNPIAVGDRLEYLGRGLVNTAHTVLSLSGPNGAQLSQANPNSLITLGLDPAPAVCENNGLFRKKMAS
ncbi:MAG: U32 family peptidase [Proteobacteria bacterium]|jgi:putative protease|nr:U32 family peptidase [Pseudomonadota bacterium]MBU4407246.1 U32 family peptidase [Pseudomonadota bacterium]MBU4411913.1 U32 family peptidase [Pseudomonadota bacterium]MDP2756987.1 U32 family peptidase [Desulfurivibrionaceae bacterium]